MTTAAEPLVYKVATEPWELEQVHELNYRTFVEEIPQHAANHSRRLVDRFDRENTYFICRRDDRVLGMVAVRGVRPWSLDTKLPNVDAYLPPGRVFCELRLLAIDPANRGGPILYGLMAELAQYCVANGHTGAVISGALRQQRLYEHIGFVPFGPVVGTPEAPYQPMYITLEKLRELRVPLARPSSATRSDGALSFLPGPVDIHPDVLAALASPPISHRDVAFMSEVEGLKRTLCEIVRATHVEVLLGSGTLANDVVAGQLSLLAGRGVVMSNGEFGDRLIDHATRAGLAFDAERREWGAPFDAAAIDGTLERYPDAAWVWMVNLETSTGVANDLPHLVTRAAARSARVAADCVSAIGTVDVDAAGVYLMTGVSGKGIGSFPGLSMVFHGGGLTRHNRIPRYLDLSLYADAGSVPFTQSSNLVRALGVASRRTMLRGGLGDLQRLGSWLRDELRDRGLTLVAPEQVATPIVTIHLGPRHSSVEIGEALQERGFALSFRSGYLRTRNWIQIAVLGDCSRKKLRALLAAWDDVVHRSNT